MTHSKLKLEVRTLENFRYAMNVLREIRGRESSIESEFVPIVDRYAMLSKYLPQGVVAKDEQDKLFSMRFKWKKMVNFAEEVADNLSVVQVTLRKNLVRDVKAFTKDVKEFRADWDKNGPQIRGLTPTEAVERLEQFKQEIGAREKMMETLMAGEELFSMRPTEYPQLVRTRREAKLLDQLYSLYLDVLEGVESYRQRLWTEVPALLASMQAKASDLKTKCRKLPKALRQVRAFHDLNATLDAFLNALPFLELFCKPSIKARHWVELNVATGSKIPLDAEVMNLAHVLDSPALGALNEATEISEGADEELAIELSLGDLKEHWDHRALSFAAFKSRPTWVLHRFELVNEELEAALLTLQTNLGKRAVEPFRENATKQLNSLSSAADVLELWVKVQKIWTSLESVFTGHSDIAKELPREAKRFAKIDKDWIKVMARARETLGVVACCNADLVANTLPVLFAELEKCEKALEVYLERKRARFPRFYLVANRELLRLLSEASDPLKMHSHYREVFDAITQVAHAASGDIVAIVSSSAGQFEHVPLAKSVATFGNVEEWLGALEKEMQVRPLPAQIPRSSSDPSE